MNRPAGMAERRTADEARRVAAVRAALAARRAEQAAAARRRLWLTLALVVVTAVGWAAFAVADFSVWLALFPTAVLAVVVWLGIRAARSEREEWSRVPESLRAPRSEPGAGPTFSASQLREHLDSAGSGAAGTATEGLAADGIGDGGLRWSTDASRSGSSPSQVAAGTPSDATAQKPAPGTWTPVPVPVPTYTLKATAVRREVTSAEVTQELPPLEESVGVEQPGIDLNAVLARRRAIGA